MRLVQHTSLQFQQGNSDKVYEVDLCEIGPDQFVVNFRYGRRGSNLREGTKTTDPVSLDKAQQIYAALVTSKTDKGYVESSVQDAPAPSTTAPLVSSTEDGPDDVDEASVPSGPKIPYAQKQAILKRLADGLKSTSGWSLSRAVWRAGELGIHEAARILPGLVGKEGDQLDYCIAWSFGRCADRVGLSALESMINNHDTPVFVRRIAAESRLILLSKAERDQEIRSLIDQLPEALRAGAAKGPADVFEEALSVYLQDATGQGMVVLEQLYSIDNDFVRPALLNILHKAPLAPPFFQRLRRVFKIAELRRDAEVFGILARRFDTTRAMFSINPYTYNNNKKPTLGSDAKKAFSNLTRLYLRRRVWNTLRRMAHAEDPAFVDMAIGVLLAFTDKDAQAVRSDIRYDYDGGNWTTRTAYWDAYGSYWAFNQILFGNSYRYEQHGQGFRCKPPFKPGGAVLMEREELFSELWDRHPEAFVRLLTESGCEPVHVFACRALRTCKTYCRQIPSKDIIRILQAPYTISAELGFELATDRYDPASPDVLLVLAVADCQLEAARQRAHTWIESNGALFLQDAHAVFVLLTAHHNDTRRYVTGLLQANPPDDKLADTLIGRLIGLLHGLGETENERAKDLSNALTTIFGNRLRTVGIDVIRDLLGHPLPAVQRLAGELVLRHETYAHEPPGDLLRALLDAPDASVREIGVRIVNQLPDALLLDSVGTLITMVRHALEDIRQNIRPTIQRLANQNVEFARRICEELIDALLTPGAPEGVPSHTARVLCDDLALHLSFVSRETVWKLLLSRSSPAQEVGGILLGTNVNANELGVDQLVRLASHDILSVRESARAICLDQFSKLCADMNQTVRLLDAKWEDSRTFAIQLFRERFTDDQLTPSVLVAVCDSVRTDIQAFGRELITQRFQEAHGQEYLLKLSEHPTVELQSFATNYLSRFATDNIDKLIELKPYFLSVLSRVNKARVAKDRILSLLEQESLKSLEGARFVAELLTRQSATGAIGDKARMIEILLKIYQAYPDLDSPLRICDVEVRDGV